MPTWTCIHCGLTYGYVLLRDVSCPKCQVPAGRNCVRPSGHAVWGPEGRFHFDRDRAALKAGAIVLCPREHTQEAHRAAQDAARAQGGFKPIVAVIHEPSGRHSPQRREYASQTRARARQQERSKVPEADRRPSERPEPVTPETCEYPETISPSETPIEPTEEIKREYFPPPKRTVTLDSFG